MGKLEVRMKALGERGLEWARRGNYGQKVAERAKPLKKLVESKATARLNFEEYRRRIRKHYDGPAGAMLRLGSITSLHEPLAGALLRTRRFDVTGCRRILDVGTGAGQMLRHLLRYADWDAQLYCMDLSARMLRRARACLETDRPRAVVSDVTRLPFADASFDCITCGWVLEHLPDPAPGLCEMARVLRPGGKMLLLTTEDTILGAMVSRLWKCRTYNRRELRQCCERVGLKWDRQLWFSPLHRALHLGGIVVEATRRTDGRSPLATEAERAEAAAAAAPSGP